MAIAIDFQEKLLPAMSNDRTLENKVCRFFAGARIMELPVVVTQQYTKGLGDTTAPIKEALGDFDHVEKKSFSAIGEPEFVKQVEELGKKTILMTGIEAHICVEQTTLDLLERGYDVFLVTDCIGSRKEEDLKGAVMRMVQAGAVPVTYEAVLYEMLGEASGDRFKAISKIVK